MTSTKRSVGDLLKRQARRKNAHKANCLLEMVAELMDERKISMADIQKATGIPWATLHDWLVAGRVQTLDGNMLALSKFFNCSINYLAFGIGDPDPICLEE